MFIFKMNMKLRVLDAFFTVIKNISVFQDNNGCEAKIWTNFKIVLQKHLQGLFKL